MRNPGPIESVAGPWEKLLAESKTICKKIYFLIEYRLQKLNTSYSEFYTRQFQQLKFFEHAKC